MIKLRLLWPALGLLLFGGDLASQPWRVGSHPEWLLRDDPTLLEYASDFGGGHASVPAVVARPRSIDDLTQAIRYAGAHNLKVVPRGAGHSMAGQSTLRDGMVLDLKELRSVYVHGRTVVADAGARWSDVVDAAFAKGLRLPVIPGYLGMTVGGTLSVGGIGPGSGNRGMQVDHVEELVVVTAEARRIGCSREHEAALFEAVLGGLGQFGVIARASLTTLPADGLVYQLTGRYDGVGPWVSDVLGILTAAGEDVDLDSVAVLEGDRWSLWLTVSSPPSQGDPRSRLRSLIPHAAAAWPADPVDYVSYAKKGGSYEEHSRRIGAWSGRHRWLNVFLPLPALAEFVESMRRIDPEAAPRAEWIQFLPVRKLSASHSILQVPTTPLGSPFVNVGVLRTAEDAADAARMDTENQRLLELATALGGKTYLIDVLPATRTGWRLHLGSHEPAVHATKALWDAEMRFGSEATRVLWSTDGRDAP